MYLENKRPRYMKHGLNKLGGDYKWTKKRKFLKD